MYRKRQQQIAQSRPWILPVSIVVALTLTITLTVTLTRPPSVVAPTAFSTFTTSNLQETVCDCTGNKEPGTDERLISNTLAAQSVSIPSPPIGPMNKVLTSLAVVFGQLIDHDITRINTDSSLGRYDIQMVPSEHYMNVSRAVHETVDGCRHPINFITPFIDATVVYGDSLSDAALLSELRVADSCLLRTSQGDLLPLSEDNMTFVAGDVRAAEQSILTALHVLFLREHNRLCSELGDYYPTWTQEQLFWKARQILIAKLQHITYEEWLPTFLGDTVYTGAEKRSDAQTVTEFSHLAFRVGHSMIPNEFGSFPLLGIFFDISIIQEVGVEPLLQAAYGTAAEKADIKIVDGLRNFLFSPTTPEGPSGGEDLFVRTLVRARELSLGNYSSIAECYGVTPEDFGDVDAFVGMFQEPLATNSPLPMLMGMIISEQFQRIKKYDPNFYTKRRANIGSPWIQQVEATTLGSLVRANTNWTDAPMNLFFV